MCCFSCRHSLRQMFHCERTMTMRMTRPRALVTAMPAVRMISSIHVALDEMSGAKIGISLKKDFPLGVNTLRGKKKYAQRKIRTLRGKFSLGNLADTPRGVFPTLGNLADTPHDVFPTLGKLADTPRDVFLSFLAIGRRRLLAL